MPVSLLGLMAIAMFYLVTVVVGLCANRCLAREDEEPENEDTGQRGGGASIEVASKSGTGTMKRDYSAEFELLHLLERTTPGPGVVSSSAATLTTPLTEFSPLDALDSSPQTAAVFDQRIVQATLFDRPSPIITYDDDHRTLSTRSAIPQDVACNNIDVCASRLRRPFSTGSVDEDSYNSLPRMSQAAVILAGGSNHARPTKTILRKSKPLAGSKFLLAERNVGYILGSLSLLAIKTGGAYSNSIAEQVYVNGLLWCQMPVACSLSLIIGGCLFANQLYSENFVTMIDPFQNVYGVRAGVILSIPVLIADILFAAVVVSSLGALLQATLGFGHGLGVACSLISVLAYLLVGGLYAGTFTDALQFIYLVLGLWLITPFALTRPHPSLSEKVPAWLGQVDGRRAGLYLDQLAVLILGGIPMQSYFQRILSSNSAKNIRVMTVAGSIGCLLNAVPAVLVGAAAKSADWTNTTLGSPPGAENASIILPMLLYEYVPNFVLFLALGALASGLMASCDSAMFGSATIITHNVYKNWLRPAATDREMEWATRISILAMSALILLLCLVWPYWHQYWLLPYDILYVLVFPQLFCVVHYRYANTYGAMFALLVGALFRLLFGETRIHLPAAWRLPFWDVEDGQLFPYRTFAMLISLLTLLFVSLFYHYLYHKGRLASTNDIFVCFAQESAKRRKRVTLETVERMTVL